MVDEHRHARLEDRARCAGKREHPVAREHQLNLHLRRATSRLALRIAVRRVMIVACRVL